MSWLMTVRASLKFLVGTVLAGLVIREEASVVNRHRRACLRAGVLCCAIAHATPSLQHTCSIDPVAIHHLHSLLCFSRETSSDNISPCVIYQEMKVGVLEIWNIRMMRHEPPGMLSKEAKLSFSCRSLTGSRLSTTSRPDPTLRSKR